MTVCVDTSAFYAFMVQADSNHRKIGKFFAKVFERHDELISTSLVLGETLGLMQHRHGVDAARRFMQSIYPAVSWRWVDSGLLREAWRILDEKNLRGFTIVDASVVAAIAERPGCACAAFDPDLTGFGFEVVPGP